MIESAGVDIVFLLHLADLGAVGPVQRPGDRDLLLAEPRGVTATVASTMKLGTAPG